MDTELRYVNPDVILAIGAPAAKILIDKNFRLREQRGTVQEKADGRKVIATLQPAYVMRLMSLADKDASDSARAQLTADLRLAAGIAGLIHVPG